MMNKISLLLLTLLLFCGTSASANSEIETRYGLGVTGGSNYTPNSDISWLQATLVALWDYDSIWPHRAPAPLAFKVETQAGATVREMTRAIASINMYAHYYLDRIGNDQWRPYVDAGIGLIYTDFQVEGQGSRINFNPQMGFGIEFKDADGERWFGGIRLHHISNAGLVDENTGLNSVTLTIGKYF